MTKTASKSRSQSTAKPSTRSLQNESDERLQDSTLFPQGSNDVLEVLCSGECTAGKLLMHFLLFYGRHFNANTTCIDVSGTHHLEYNLKSQLSPFIARKAGGGRTTQSQMYIPSIPSSCTIHWKAPRQTMSPGAATREAILGGRSSSATILFPA